MWVGTLGSEFAESKSRIGPARRSRDLGGGSSTSTARTCKLRVPAKGLQLVLVVPLDIMPLTFKVLFAAQLWSASALALAEMVSWRADQDHNFSLTQEMNQELSRIVVVLRGNVCAHVRSISEYTLQVSSLALS